MKIIRNNDDFLFISIQLLTGIIYALSQRFSIPSFQRFLFALTRCAWQQ